MSVCHVLRGYSRHTDGLVVQYDVPNHLLGEIATHVVQEEGDNDLFAIYPLDRKSALTIAKIIGREMQIAKDISENDFFLESEADIDTVNHQISELSLR